jgi:hypothetical protein
MKRVDRLLRTTGHTTFFLLSNEAFFSLPFRVISTPINCSTKNVSLLLYKDVDSLSSKQERYSRASLDNAHVDKQEDKCAWAQ